MSFTHTSKRFALQLIWCHVACFGFALLLLSSLAKASIDNVRFERFFVENGLSQHSINAIFQDSKGFIWIGTQEGLNRYDGSNFEHYVASFDNPNSLLSSWVTDITEDAHGNLWIGTHLGVSKLNLDTNEFTNYRASEKEHGLNDGVVRKVLRDNRDNIWVTTRKGLNKFLPSENRFNAYNLTGSSGESVDVFAIEEDITGGLWLGTNKNGLYRFDPTTETFSLVAEVTNSDKSVNISQIRALLIDRHQRLWIGSLSNGSYFLDLTQAKSESPGENLQTVPGMEAISSIAIFEDLRGVLWFGTNSGLVYLDLDGKIGNLKNRVEDLYSLSSDAVRTIYEDFSGVLWVGSFNGLNKWNTATTQFEHYRAVLGSSQSLSGNDITAISAIDEQSIVIANTTGTDMLNLSTGEVTPIELTSKDGDTEINYKVMSAEPNGDGKVWLGTQTAGLFLYDISEKSYKQYRSKVDAPNADQYLQSNGITTIYKQNDDTVWIGTYGGGLSKLDLQTDIVTTYRHKQDDIYTLSSDRIMTIQPTKDGLLWLGTWDAGVSIFNPATESAFRIEVDPQDKTGLSSNLVWAILEDEEGNIWIGTHGGGIHLLRKENRDTANIQFERITREHGLLSDAIFSIKQDVDGYLWTSSNHGLAKIDPKDLSIMKFTYSMGLQSNVFNSGSAYQMPDGEMFFGGSSGVTGFHPRDLGFNQYSPQPVLTAFQRFDKVNSIATEMNSDGEITVQYTDYLIGFEFAAMHFVAPEKNQYKYRLRGFEDEWIDNGTNTKATYTNLPAGKYTFEVMSANSDGIWSENPARVSLIVRPAPWESAYAYAVYLLILLSLAYAVYRSYRKKLDAETSNRQLLELEVSKRTQELSLANERLLTASITDQLTGLYNRRYLYDIISDKSARVYERFSHEKEHDLLTHDTGTRLFFIMFDLDGFKPVNDTYGHDAGDSIIQQVASLLKDICRMNDTVIRWGGDEFLIVGECASQAEVAELVEAIRLGIEKYSFDVGVAQRLHLSSSIGFSLYPFSHHAADSLTWEQAHILADNALYQSKDEGKNTWTGIVQSESAIPFTVMNALVAKIEQAIEQQQVTILKCK